jgi:hypothetical protein
MAELELEYISKWENDPWLTVVNAQPIESQSLITFAKSDYRTACYLEGSLLMQGQKLDVVKLMQMVSVLNGFIVTDTVYVETDRMEEMDYIFPVKLEDIHG